MNEITINRGSDLTLTGTWRDATGQRLNLTGWEIEMFEPHPTIQAATAEWIDAAQGSYRVVVPWNDNIRTGRSANFRLRIRNANGDKSSPQIWVIVQ